MSDLTAAENKFFESKGTEVDPALKPDAPPEVKPEPAQDAAPAPTPDATPPAPKPDDREVSLRALQQERARRQMAEQQLQEMQRAIQQAQAEYERQQKTPDPQEDPIGAIQYQNEQLKAQLEQVAQWRQQQETAQQQAAFQAELVNRVAQSAREFAQQAPDYPDAWKFITEARSKQLAPLIADPVQREQVMMREALEIATQAMQQGMNPAQRYYEIAKAWGYSGGGSAAPHAAAPAAPTQAPAVESPAVETIKRGMRQQTGISGGGSTPSTEMTPQQLAAIRDPKAFAAAWDKVMSR